MKGKRKVIHLDAYLWRFQAWFYPRWLPEALQDFLTAAFIAVVTIQVVILLVRG